MDTHGAPVPTPRSCHIQPLSCASVSHVPPAGPAAPRSGFSARLAGQGRGLPEMTPGQATDGNPKTQATQTVAASCLQVLQAPPQPPRPATSLPPPSGQKEPFLTQVETPNQLLGAVAWRS